MTTDKIIAAAREAGFNASNGFSLLIVRHSNGSWIDVSEELTTFYALAFKAGMERAAEIAADVDEPGWTGYECPNTFDDGRRAAVEAIRAHAQNHPKPTHDSSVV